jgi:hypothetical protein
VVQAAPALAALADEMGAAQEAQVLGNRRARDGKGAGDATGRQAAAAQEVQDGAPRRIGERAEGRLH